MVQFLDLQNPFHNDKLGVVVCRFLTALSNHHSPHFRSTQEADFLLNQTLGAVVWADCRRARMGLSLDESHGFGDPHWLDHFEYNHNGGRT